MTNKKKMTLTDLFRKKSESTPITMLTAYDYSQAKMVEAAGADMILIGDSLGMTVLGYDSTVYVTMEDMLHHCKAVKRGASRPFLVGDMPFMSYQTDIADAVRNAGRFIKEAGVDCVKLEGGASRVKVIKAIVSAGIPVVGHIGLTPQTATQLGGYKVQGKTAEAAEKLLQDALMLEQAGCFMIVLEAVPARLAAIISEKLSIPTVGIGAGAGCDGQVLVYHDLLGIFDDFVPKFVKKYANLKEHTVDALKQYCLEVEARQFPAPEHSYEMEEGEFERFLKRIEHELA